MSVFGGKADINGCNLGLQGQVAWQQLRVLDVSVGSDSEVAAPQLHFRFTANSRLWPQWWNVGNVLNYGHQRPLQFGDMNDAQPATDPRVADLVQAGRVRVALYVRAWCSERSITPAGAECALHRQRKSIEQIDW